MDLTQLSDSDLLALQAGDLTKVSNAGLAILNQGQPKSPTLRESFERGAGLAYRSMAPTLTGAGIGSYGGPLGAVFGSMAVPAADAVNSLLNLIASPFTDKRLIPASQGIQNLMTRAGVTAAPETQTPTERVVGAGLESMTGVAQSAYTFGAQQMPEVVEQLLVWETARLSLLFVLFALGFIASLWGLKSVFFSPDIAKAKADAVAAKAAYDAGEPWTRMYEGTEVTSSKYDRIVYNTGPIQKESDIAVLIFSAMGFVLFGLATADVGLKLLKLTIAPKVWLIEYAAGLVK